jgi:hypothetical protein
MNRLESALTKVMQRQLTSIELWLVNQTAKQLEFLKNLEISVKRENESAIPKLLGDLMEPLKMQLRLDTAQIDRIVQENLTKIVGGPQMQETLTTTVQNAVKPALEQTFKEVFQGVLLPGIEKACQNMFKQVQDAFLLGTRECKFNANYDIDRLRM